MKVFSEKTTKAWVLALTSVASFMVALDALVVTTALNTIRLHLGASIEMLEWTVNAYILSFAVLLMMGAALGDRFGRRRMFVVGLGLFAGASAACALARDVNWLIAARAVQGGGAALIMPLAMTILSAAFPPEQRGRALGIFIGVAILAAVFASLGSYHSAQSFSNGFVPAIGVSAGLSLAGAIIGLTLPGKGKLSFEQTKPEVLETGENEPAVALESSASL